MDAKLDRLLRLPTVTLGSLFLRGPMPGDPWVWECYTKEPPVRTDGVFVAGESALPEGPYNVSLPFSKRHGRAVPLAVSSQLVGAGGLRYALGMRFSPGHYTLDTEASCIVVGQEQGPKDVHRTRMAAETLFDKWAKAVNRCEAIDLLITSS